MIPLSLYIHIPWCIQKCPYCDFNSHKKTSDFDEHNYIDALINDLKQDTHSNQLAKSQQFSRPLHSIFIGGGTPSLFSASAFERLFEVIFQLFNSDEPEITLEANPGTVEQQRFKDYRSIGINRLSIGIQSFDDDKLSRLGRIHDATAAHKAIDAAINAGFDNFNLDIMHGLPNQTVEQGINDLQQAISHQPSHLSWYQLTIEPNTLFYKKTPTLPDEEKLAELEQQGLALLANAGYQRYEISAYAKDNKTCQHNNNYWQFGDYLAIGAGAHGKLTTPSGIKRWQKHRMPKDYLSPNKDFTCSENILTKQDILFEFMLNTTRLEQTISYDLFEQYTKLPISMLLPMLQAAEKKGFIKTKDSHFKVTPLGRRFTNELQLLFME